MIQEFDDNEVFSTDYLNTPPQKGDLAAIYEKGGRNLLMARDENGIMTLPEAVLFSKYWFDPGDPEADRKAEAGCPYIRRCAASGARPAATWFSRA